MFFVLRVLDGRDQLQRCHVVRLIKRFCIKKEWKSNHLRAAEHARDVGGIRGKDDKIMYGELGELHGVRLDPTSKASEDGGGCDPRLSSVFWPTVKVNPCLS